MGVAGKSFDDIRSANDPGSIEAVTMNNQLYAFPFAMDGYFMFCDPDFVSEEQAQNWDTLLDAAQAAGKRVGMVLSSGWYDASFFYGAGFTTGLNEDGTTSIDWNGTSPSGVTGVQVVKAMQKIAGHPAFMAISRTRSRAAACARSSPAPGTPRWSSRTSATTTLPESCPPILPRAALRFRPARSTAISASA